MLLLLLQMLLNAPSVFLLNRQSRLPEDPLVLVLSLVRLPLLFFNQFLLSLDLGQIVSLLNNQSLLLVFLGELLHGGQVEQALVVFEGGSLGHLTPPLNLLILLRLLALVALPLQPLVERLFQLPILLPLIHLYPLDFLHEGDLLVDLVILFLLLLGNECALVLVLLHHLVFHWVDQVVGLLVQGPDLLLEIAVVAHVVSDLLQQL